MLYLQLASCQVQIISYNRNDDSSETPLRKFWNYTTIFFFFFLFCLFFPRIQAVITPIWGTHTDILETTKTSKQTSHFFFFVRNQNNHGV